MDRSASPRREYRKSRFPRPKMAPSAHSSPATLPSGSTSSSTSSIPRMAPVHFGEQEDTVESLSADCLTARPALSSKFSSDNLSSSKRMLHTKAWLRDLAASARSSTISTSSSAISNQPLQKKPIVIGLPELQHGEKHVPNERLGQGARRVDKPTDAFTRLNRQDGLMDYPVRSSEDSTRSYATTSTSISTTSSFGNEASRRQRALPLLPLRIDSLPKPRRACGESRTVGRLRVDADSSSRRDDAAPAVSAESIKEKTSQEARPARNGENTLSLPISGIRQLHPNQPSRPTPPFHATPLGPVRAFPADMSDADMSDADKLVSLHISGRIFTASLSTVLSRPSHLADYLQQILLDAANTATASTTSPLHSFDARDAPTVRVTRLNKPMLLSPSAEPAQVTLQFPPSPIYRVRSARASIFEDVPSDEAVEDGDEDDQHGLRTAVSPPPISGWLKSHSYLRPPDIAIRRVSGATSDGSASKYSPNFLDTTPDAEAADPFHFQSYRSPYPFPAIATLSSQPPSLSSSPNSSAFDPAQLELRRPFDALEAHATRGIDILLDRPAEPYETVLHYLREGELPRRLRFSYIAARFDPTASERNESESRSEAELLRAVQKLSQEARTAILPLLLYPTISALENLEEEAAFLGTKQLEELCRAELALLQKLLNTASRSDSGRTQACRDQKTERRPKMDALKQYKSEADVMQSWEGSDEDGWI